MGSVIYGLDIICAQFIVSVWGIAAALLAGTGFVIWRTRGRRRLFGALAGSAVTLVAVTVAAAASVNAYYAYLPTIGDAAHAVTGDRQWVALNKIDNLSASQRRHALRAGLVVRAPMPADPANGLPASTTVEYLPPQYFADPTARFPVVYLFHGSPGQPGDWFHAGDARQAGELVAHAGRPAIIVAPRMSRSWTDDPQCVDGAKEKVESHLLQKVIPMTDSTLRTYPTRDARVFAGMSAGGYCALNLGLRNRGTVATIIDMSGDTIPTHTGGNTALFGRDAAALAAANSPQHYATALSADPAMRVWLDSGSEDVPIVRQMAALTPELAAHGVDVRWRVRPGGHTYWVWKSALQESLPWALGGPPGKAPVTSRPGPNR